MLPITHNPLPNTQENLTPSDDGYERDKDDPKRGEMILKSGEMFPVYDSDITKLEQTYQTIDVVYQLKMMKAWLESNPNKHKTKILLRQKRIETFQIQILPVEIEVIVTNSGFNKELIKIE